MSSDELTRVAQRVLGESLGVKGGEGFSFFTDFNSPWEERFAQMVERRRFLHSLYEAFVEVSSGLGNGKHDKYQSTTRHGGEPGENVWRLAFGETIYGRLLENDLLWKLKGEVDLTALEEEKIDAWLGEYESEIVRCVAAFPWYSITHTRFTRLLRKTGCRIASMPMLTQSVLEGPMRANWDDVAKTTQRVYDGLLRCSHLHLTCPAGTDLTVEIGAPELVHKDTGLLRDWGALGNLPAGEAYLVPKAGSASGTLVLTSGPERPQVTPTVAAIEDGQVAFFKNETEYSQLLEEKFQRDFRFRHFAEVGIGTNPLAKDVSSMIEGEKIQGTVHVALGDDKSMGGQTEASEHWDHILVGVSLEGRLRSGGRIEFIKNGVLLP
jgi:aminopeptidase